MELINLLYIDDEVDANISYYLAETLQTDLGKIEYNQIEFNNIGGYEVLLNNLDVKKADLIIIDSRLFENGQVNVGKFTGEEFKIILKRIFPFKEVIVITQNDIEEDYGILSKYDNRKHNEQQKYYNDYWKKKIEESIKNILIYRNLLQKLKDNNNIEKVLMERIINSINGSDEYDKLTSGDIDELVNAFKDLQRRYYE